MRLLGLRPWWLGPVLLVRRPGVALALVAAAFVVTLPAAAAPLFLSSARSATLHHQIAETCRWTVGARITGGLPFVDPQFGPPSDPAALDTSTGTGLLRRREEAAARAVAAAPALGPPVTSLYTTADVAPGGSRPATERDPVTFVYRDDFAAHLDVRSGPSGDGLWIPDTYASYAALKVGDVLTVPSAPGVRLPVAAVYTDLRSRAADDPYWCSLRVQYRGVPGQEFSNTPIPPMVLLSRPGLLDLAAHVGRTQHVMEYPLRNARPTQPEALRTAAEIDRLRAALQDGQPDEAPFSVDPPYSVHIGSPLGQYADRAELVRKALRPTVVPVTVAGTLVGLLVVAAAAAFWVQRRRRELAVLAVHGVSPRGLGLKAVTEALPAVVAGAAAACAAAWALVRWAGPSPVLSAEAPRWSLLLGGGALAVTLVLLAGTAAARTRGLTDQSPARRRRRLRLGVVPWELLLLAAAVPLWLKLSGSHELAAPAEGTGAVAQVPAKLLAVPIVVVAGTATLAARLAAIWLRRRARRRGPRGNGTYLAWRRLAREAAVAATLAAATAVPIALAAYGSVVTGSVRATLAAEARTIVGADVVLTLARPAPVPASLAGRATEVLRLRGVDVNGVSADVLAVDPTTFPRDAFWDARLDGGRSLRDLADRLSNPAGTGRATVFGSEPVDGGEQTLRYHGYPMGTVDIQPVDRLPAQQGGYPVVLARTDVLGDDAQYAVPQLWVRGDPAAVRAAATAAKLPLTGVDVADDLYAGTVYEPLTYTFDYLTALSLLTGLIAAVGLVLYLEGRGPAHRRGYVLLRRMGLRRASHRWALVAEVALPLAAGLGGGLALAAAITAAVRGDIEVNPQTPPDTVLAVPTGTVVAASAAIAVLALAAAAYADRRVARADPAEVLRDSA